MKGGIGSIKKKSTSVESICNLLQSPDSSVTIKLMKLSCRPLIVMVGHNISLEVICLISSEKVVNFP